MSQLTISDIAKKAGVSRTTVSRVLNNSPSVNKATRENVLSIIKANDYSPSAAARSLSKQVSDTIGVIVPEIDNPFFGEMLRGIIEVMDQHGLTMMCCNTDDTITKDLNSLDLMKNHRVRGLIYTPATDYSNSKEKNTLLKVLRSLNIPLVQVDRQVNGIDADQILFRDTEGIYEATKKLIKAGHRKIAIINAHQEQYLARVRQEGFVKAMSEAGLPIKDEYQFFGDFRIAKAYELSQKMLAMPNRPTAVITCNNNTTIGLLKALHERNESIPEDIACIGLDEIKSLNYAGANLNFIQRNAHAMGKKAMEILISRIAFPEKPKQIIYLDTPLVIHSL